MTDPRQMTKHSELSILTHDYVGRIINTSAATHFKVWLDGHDFDVVAIDFVPVNATSVKSVFVGIGMYHPT